MSRAVTNPSAIDVTTAQGIALFTYSIVSYLIGVVGLGLLILATTGFGPLGTLQIATSPWAAAAMNVVLLLLFGIQHSVMARAAFKQRLYTILPKALERSTFVWTSGAAMSAVVLFWQPIDGLLWQTSGVPRWILLGIGVGGWIYLLAATFAINHWDVFGLRQSWLAARGHEYESIPFTEKWMYRYSRHPIMLGVFVGIWSIPTMTATQLFLSSGLTVYVVIGLYFEERDLIRQWGQTYLNYKQRVGSLLSISRR